MTTKKSLAVKAKHVAKAGRGGDTELVHVNKDERAQMVRMFGPETKNPETHLPEHSLGSIMQTLAPLANFIPIPGVGKAVSIGMGVLGGALDASSRKKDAAKNAQAPAPYVPAAKAPTFSAKLPGANGIFADLAAKPSGLQAIDYEHYGQTGAKKPAEAAFYDYAKSPEEQQTALAVKPAATATPESAKPVSWMDYMTLYPDVMDQYNKVHGAGLAQGLGMSKDKNADLTPEEFAQYHYNQFGRGEGRINPYGQVIADNTASYTQQHPLAVQPPTSGSATPEEMQAAQDYYAQNPVQGYKRGGRTSFAVKGAGDGRSDEIDAKLSDGEYVMDAETVSLLGNGSTEAGAEALDKFRVNVRKHKGANLAKGKFSVNAKQPHAYMAGGRT